MREVPAVTAEIVGAFAKLRVASLRFVISVRAEQLGSHYKDFHDVLHMNIFRNLSRKFKFGWNLIRIAGTLREDISPNSAWIEMHQTKIVEKIKAHILYLVTSPAQKILPFMR